MRVRLVRSDDKKKNSHQTFHTKKENEHEKKKMASLRTLALVD